MSILIGSDPEVFLFDPRTGSPISSIGLIGGSKKSPRPLERQGFALQEDNVAVEFNIPPADTMQAFVESIEWSIKRIEKEVEPMGYKVNISAAVDFPENQLEHPNARLAGCDPDYNAWTRTINPRPNVSGGQMRTGAGHVHIGVGKPAPLFTRETLIKACDLFLGVPSTILDQDIKRKALYGKAGAFRPTKYGCEYRVLSNFWLRERKLMEWVYTQTHEAFKAAGERGEKFFDDLQATITETINNADHTQARALMKEYSIAGV